MKITQEKTLWSIIHNQKLWSGGQANAEIFTPNELDQIEELLEGIHPDGWDITDLNDAFAFDIETIASWVITAEEFAKRKNWDMNDLDKDIWDLPF